jgi:hypothetical protein
VRRSRLLQTCDRGYFAERNASYPDFRFDFKSTFQFIHIWPARDIVHDFSLRTSPWSFALEKERERLDDTGLADIVRAEKNTVVRKYDLPFLNAATFSISS